MQGTAVQVTWRGLPPTPPAMNRVKEVERINAKDVALQLRSDTVGNAGKWDVSKSWHAQYKDSAYVYVGGLPYDLSEGDVIVVFSQFGEIVDVNMPRDKDTGKPKGFAFIAYEDQRSTVLAVDNFNGAKLMGRTLRCDHCASFHEEQKKDPAKLPDHVTRKLTDAQIEEKQAEVERRNAELEAATNAKEELFAVGRGTVSEAARDEAQIRAQILDRKEADAAAKRSAHINAVLAKRKADNQHSIDEEKRQEEERQERRRQREEALRNEALQAEKKPDPPAYSVAAAAETTMPAVSVSKWERFMGGGGPKKKKKKSKDERMDTDLARMQRESSTQGQDGGPGDGISVEETDALRASLGLKPLKR